MKRYSLAVMALLLTGLAGCATYMPRDCISITSECYWQPQGKIPQRVAVLDFEGEKLQQGLVSAGGVAITNVLVGELLKAGFTVVERDHLSDVLLEHGMLKGKAIDASDVELAQQLGRMLNAEAIVTGKLLRRNMPLAKKAGKGVAFATGGTEVSARAIDVATGQIIWMCTMNVLVESKTGTVIRYPDYIEEACAELVYSLKTQDYKNKKNASYVKEAKIKELRATRGF